MLIAYRNGGAEELIPLAFRERYARSGYAFREAPAGLPEVSVPTPLAEVLRLVPPSSSEAAGSASSPEPAAIPDAPKKRGRR